MGEAMDAEFACPSCGAPVDAIEVTGVGDSTRSYIPKCGDCTPLSGRRLGSELCEALGLNGKMVRRITIDASVTEVATVTVEMLASRNGRAAPILRQYRLEPDDDIQAETA